MAVKPARSIVHFFHVMGQTTWNAISPCTVRKECQGFITMWRMFKVESAVLQALS